MRKFQTLNSSCAYTGIANLLAQYQIDTEDKDIIIGSNAAFQLLYDKQKNTFLAGCRIQGKKWFNYYLNTIGFSFNEIETGIEDYIFSLKNNAPAHIIGFYLGNNEKHTVVYEGIENNLYKY